MATVSSVIRFLRRTVVCGCALLLAAAAYGSDEDGLVTKPSAHSVAETVKRLEALVREGGGTVFFHLDFAAEAQKAGETIPPSDLLLFGNMRGGAKLLASAPASGVDLPQRVLVWQDADGKVWLTYSTFAYLGQRHRIAGRGFLLGMGDDNLDLLTDKAAR